MGSKLKVAFNYHLAFNVLFIFLFFNVFVFGAKVQASDLSCSSTEIDEFIDVKYAKFLTIDIPNSRKWNKNYFKALKDDFSGRDTILKKYKKKFNANIKVLFDNGLECYFSAKVRISGDNKDHLYNKDYLYNNHQFSKSPITSLDVSLLDGNINSVTKFKLFIPSTREGDNEIFLTTFLQELGFLAPKTYYVDSSFNGQKTIFIFQEKITKEFLESNNLREAPILEGDERFLFSNDLKGFNRFGLARISNKNWTNKGETSLEISKAALDRINKIYLDYLYKSHIDKDPNSALVLTNIFSDVNRDRDRIFRSILTASGARHALLPHNRRFYYDPMYKYIRPIYYDGDSSIIKLNSLSGKISSLNNSEIIGAEMAITYLDSLNRKNFKDKLEILGLDYDFQEVELILDNVLSNLKLMSNTLVNRGLNNHYTPYFSQYKDLSKDVENKRLVFFTEESFSIEVCNFSLTSCSLYYLNLKDYAKLLSGRYEDANGIAYIYVGNKDEYISGLSVKNYNKINKVYLENNVQLIGYGSPTISINKNDKQIKLRQNNINDRILIRGGVLNNWSINFIGYTVNGNNNKQRFNQDLLTGCLTLLDIHINNVSINIDESQCEDSVNIIRATGRLNTVTVNNASNDAIDVDFSKLSFDNIIIKNSGNDCIDLSYGDYYINNAALTGCVDKAISVGEKSNLTIDFSKISNSNIGVVAKDSSVVKVGNVVNDDVAICFSAYNKKQEFWGGKIIVNNHNCQPSQIYQKKNSLVEFVQ
jgi:hypothetical protein